MTTIADPDQTGVDVVAAVAAHEQRTSNESTTNSAGKTEPDTLSAGQVIDPVPPTSDDDRSTWKVTFDAGRQGP